MLTEKWKMISISEYETIIDIYRMRICKHDVLDKLHRYSDIFPAAEALLSCVSAANGASVEAILTMT